MWWGAGERHSLCGHGLRLQCVEQRGPECHISIRYVEVCLSAGFSGKLHPEFMRQRWRQAGGDRTWWASKEVGTGGLTGGAGYPQRFSTYQDLRVLPGWRSDGKVLLRMGLQLFPRVQTGGPIPDASPARRRPRRGLLGAWDRLMGN